MYVLSLRNRLKTRPINLTDWHFKGDLKNYALRQSKKKKMSTDCDDDLLQFTADPYANP